MKKILSVFLAILIMVTSCVCALTVFAAEPCVDHVVNVWANNNKKNHLGTCTVCNQEVKQAHVLEFKNKVDATCTTDGYTYYTCVCGYAEERDTVRSFGHDIISTTYNYDVNGDGVYNELDVKYNKTSECRNCGEFESGTGNIGNSNYCPSCENYTLLGKTIVNATCRTADYTIYRCSNTDCDSEFEIYGKELLDCNYIAEVEPATCTAEGFTLNTCKMCGDSYKDNYIPASGHKLNMAGSNPDEGTTYTYSGGKCTITGWCSVCKTSQTITALSATPEKCTSCEKAINSKTVYFPASCEESIRIETNCNSCPTQEIVANPIGHSSKTATYVYHDNGELETVEIDCYDCDSKTSKGDEYNTANRCIVCSSVIEKRVVVAATCEANGYTKVTCPECGEYTESTKASLTHNSKEAEWIFDRDSGTYTFKANCKKDGCNGYTFKAANGNVGKCARCGKDALAYKKVVYASCEFNGYTNAECTYCGSYDEYDIKAVLPHDYVSTTEKADCEKGGATKNTCKNCYYTVETNKTEPLGHIGGVESIDYNGTLKVTKGWCDRCTNPYEKTESYKDSEDDCANGHKNSITSKVVVKPDCKSNTSGYTRVTCKTCGIYNTDIIPAAHKFGGWRVVLEPTCVDKGLRERTCELCSSVEQDEMPADQTVTGDPKHKYVVTVKGIPATCTEPGLSDEMYCSSCGDYQRAMPTEALGHDFELESKNENYCDRCDSYVIGEGSGAIPCSCMCHNRDGLAKFFFKILLFFCQIIGINQKCECGTIHY